MTDKLPNMCFTVNLATGDIVAVKRGEVGYYPATVYELDHADALNERLGVSHAMREAMTMGSCFGWDVPGARNPDLYKNAVSLVDADKRRNKR